MFRVKCLCGKTYTKSESDIKLSADGRKAISLDCGFVPLNTVTIKEA